MSKYIRSILLLLCCVNKIIPLLAHDTAGYNRINLSYAAQYYFNKPNIVGNGIEPDLINTKNNFGRYISLEYERVTPLVLWLYLRPHMPQRLLPCYYVQALLYSRKRTGLIKMALRKMTKRSGCKILCNYIN